LIWQGTGLKLKEASNSDIDRVFEAMMIGPGGGSTAALKDVHAALWALGARAGHVDPRIEKLLSAAATNRQEAKSVQTVLASVEAVEQAEQHLRSLTGDDAPVVAQLGAYVIKRNMKLGEVVAKWGDVRATIPTRLHVASPLALDTHTHMRGHTDVICPRLASHTLAIYPPRLAQLTHRSGRRRSSRCSAHRSIMRPSGSMCVHWAWSRAWKPSTPSSTKSTTSITLPALGPSRPPRSHTARL
jgi:hypothetical protein